MAIETVDVYIRPEDGWTLVATDPVSCLIKPETFHPWWVAITASGPPAVADVAAALALNFSGNVSDGDTVTINGRVYTFVAAFDSPGDDEVLIGGNQAASEANLTAAINGRAEIPAVAATGSFTVSGGVPVDSETFEIGSDVYTFVTAASNDFEVTIGGDAAETALNMISVINTNGTEPVTASDGGTGVVTLTANVPGYAGNSITIDDTSATNVTESGSTLTGGNDAGPEISPNDYVTAADGAGAVTVTSRTPGAQGNEITVAESSTSLAWAGGATSLQGGVSPVIGIPMGRSNDAKHESFQTGEITGEVYIRVATPSSREPVDQKTRFGVIRDVA